MNISAVDHYNSLAKTRLHFARWGHRGPGLVFVHPIGFDHTTWDRIAPHFQHEYQIVAPDLPGHGRSDKPAAVDYGVLALGARLIKLLDELGWDDAVFVGNSIGGGASLAAAVLAPQRVKGLAVINTVAYGSGLPLVGRLAFVPVAPLVSCYAPSPFRRIGLDFARHGWGNTTSDRCDQAGRYLRDPAGRAAFFRTLRQLYGPDLDRMAGHYHQIRCPTLVLHGVNDPLIRLWHAEKLAAEIPTAELLRLPRCGHFPQEERPREVLGALTPFLDRLATTYSGQSLAASAP